MDDLEQRVAAVIRNMRWSSDAPDQAARAIIPIVLEHAAKVADRCGRPVGGGDGSTYISGTSADAAAAIRAIGAR